MDAPEEKPDPTSYMSFADYAREQAGDRGAGLLEDLIRDFWAGEFEGERFADREERTAIVRRTNPPGAGLNDDDGDERYYTDDGLEVYEPHYGPVTRQGARWLLWWSGWFPFGADNAVGKKARPPTYSRLMAIPLSRYSEMGAGEAQRGFDYLVALRISRQDFDRWLAGRCGDEVDADVAEPCPIQERGSQKSSDASSLEVEHGVDPNHDERTAQHPGSRKKGEPKASTIKGWRLGHKAVEDAKKTYGTKNTKLAASHAAERTDRTPAAFERDWYRYERYRQQDCKLQE